MIRMSVNARSSFIFFLFCLVFFSCSRKNFNNIDYYEKFSKDNDSLFMVLRNELVSDTNHIGKHITKNTFGIQREQEGQNVNYASLFDSLGIHDIHVTPYTIEFRLYNITEETQSYNIWYIYRSSPMQEKKTDKVYVKKISEGKYIVAQTLW